MTEDTAEPVLEDEEDDDELDRKENTYNIRLVLAGVRPGFLLQLNFQDEKTIKRVFDEIRSDFSRELKEGKIHVQELPSDDPRRHEFLVTKRPLHLQSPLTAEQYREYLGYLQAWNGDESWGSVSYYILEDGERIDLYGFRATPETIKKNLRHLKETVKKIARTLRVPETDVGMDINYKVVMNMKGGEKVIDAIKTFCSSLRANKVKATQELFQNLPETVQQLFLDLSYKILSDKKKYPEDSYRTAFYIFKLFRGKDMKALDVYEKYRKNSRLEILYKSANEWNKESKGSTSKSKGSPGSRKKSYDKEYQKYEEPPDDVDPLYIFYTSLYEQRPDSRLAITWLTEHGVFDDEKREELIEKYKELVKEKKLIK